MLHSEEFDKARSETNTYVIPIFTGSNYSGIKFKKFTVPEEYKNNPTWYFYNRLDIFSCGGNAFPFEMYQLIEEVIAESVNDLEYIEREYFTEEI